MRVNRNQQHIDQTALAGGHGGKGIGATSVAHNLSRGNAVSFKAADMDSVVRGLSQGGGLQPVQNGRGNARQNHSVVETRAIQTEIIRLQQQQAAQPAGMRAPVYAVVGGGRNKQPQTLVLIKEDGSVMLQHTSVTTSGARGARTRPVLLSPELKQQVIDAEAAKLQQEQAGKGGFVPLYREVTIGTQKMLVAISGAGEIFNSDIAGNGKGKNKVVLSEQMQAVLLDAESFKLLERRAAGEQGTLYNKLEVGGIKKLVVLRANDQLDAIDYSTYKAKGFKEAKAVDKALGEMMAQLAANPGAAVKRTVKAGDVKFKITLQPDGSFNIERIKKKSFFGKIFDGIGKALGKFLPVLSVVSMFVPGMQWVGVASKVFGAITSLKSGDIFSILKSGASFFTGGAAAVINKGFQAASGVRQIADKNGDFFSKVDGGLSLLGAFGKEGSQFSRTVGDIQKWTNRAELVAKKDWAGLTLDFAREAGQKAQSERLNKNFERWNNGQELTSAERRELRTQGLIREGQVPISGNAAEQDDSLISLDKPLINLPPAFDIPLDKPLISLPSDALSAEAAMRLTMNQSLDRRGITDPAEREAYIQQGLQLATDNKNKTPEQIANESMARRNIISPEGQAAHRQQGENLLHELETKQEQIRFNQAANPTNLIENKSIKPSPGQYALNEILSSALVNPSDINIPHLIQKEKGVLISDVRLGPGTTSIIPGQTSEQAAFTASGLVYDPNGPYLVKVLEQNGNTVNYAVYLNANYKSPNGGPSGTAGAAQQTVKDLNYQSLLEYQKQRGLPTTGKADSATVEAISSDLTRSRNLTPERRQPLDRAFSEGAITVSEYVKKTGEYPSLELLKKHQTASTSAFNGNQSANNAASNTDREGVKLTQNNVSDPKAERFPFDKEIQLLQDLGAGVGYTFQSLDGFKELGQSIYNTPIGQFTRDVSEGINYTLTGEGFQELGSSTFDAARKEIPNYVKSLVYGPFSGTDLNSSATIAGRTVNSILPLGIAQNIVDSAIKVAKGEDFSGTNLVLSLADAGQVLRSAAVGSNTSNFKNQLTTEGKATISRGQASLNAFTQISKETGSDIVIFGNGKDFVAYSGKRLIDIPTAEAEALAKNGYQINGYIQNNSSSGTVRTITNPILSSNNKNNGLTFSSPEQLRNIRPEVVPNQEPQSSLSRQSQGNTGASSLPANVTSDPAYKGDQTLGVSKGIFDNGATEVPFFRLGGPESAIQKQFDSVDMDKVNKLMEALEKAPIQTTKTNDGMVLSFREIPVGSATGKPIIPTLGEAQIINEIFSITGERELSLQTLKGNPNDVRLVLGEPVKDLDGVVAAVPLLSDNGRIRYQPWHVHPAKPDGTVAPPSPEDSMLGFYLKTGTNVIPQNGTELWRTPKNPGSGQTISDVDVVLARRDGKLIVSPWGNNPPPRGEFPKIPYTSPAYPKNNKPFEVRYEKQGISANGVEFNQYVIGGTARFYEPSPGVSGIKLENSYAYPIDKNGRPIGLGKENLGQVNQPSSEIKRIYREFFKYLRDHGYDEVTLIETRVGGGNSNMNLGDRPEKIYRIGD